MNLCHLFMHYYFHTLSFPSVNVFPPLFHSHGLALNAALKNQTALRTARPVVFNNTDVIKVDPCDFELLAG